jgi:zona occludens toxin
MSITLVTGVPGSGKTLYTVDKLVRPLIGAVETKTGDRGEKIDIPRIIYSNINGLLLDHEFIEGGGEWSFMPPVTVLPGQNVRPASEEVVSCVSGGKTWYYTGNPFGLKNWIHWAKPGSIIVFDEFQKFWPPRPNGAPIPPDLQTLDTHRHMGVDFILVCQNCMNVDRHILGLVDRHLHIRRVANMPLATVYEWDHASKSLLYKNSLAKKPYRYNKGVYKLYKSAELHTKQRRNLPSVIWFVLAGLAGFSYAAPTLKARIDAKIHGEPVTISSPAAPGQKPPGQPLEPLKPAFAAFAAAVPVSAPSAVPESFGCVVSAGRCGCFDAQGKKVPAEPVVCLDVAGSYRSPPATFSDSPKPSLPVDDAELDALRFSFNNRQKQQKTQLSLN